MTLQASLFRRSLFGFWFLASVFPLLTLADQTNRRLAPAYLETLLIDWQKPQNLEKKSDQSKFRAFLKSNFVDEKPDLVAGAMQSLLTHSTQNYNSLIREFPRLRKLDLRGVSKNRFRTSREERQVRKAAKAYLENQVAELLPDSDPLAGSQLSDWTNLTPLGPVLGGISSNFFWQTSDDIMESFVFAARREEYQGIYTSLLAKYSEQAVAPVLGKNENWFTNLEIIRSQGHLVPMLFSSRPIAKLAEIPNRYGYFTARLPELVLVDKNEIFQFQWETAGKKFKAQVQVYQMSKVPLIPEGDAPDYEALWSDQKLNGLIVFGATLKEDVEQIRKAYLTYFSKQGFALAEEMETIENLKDYLQGKIVSGETDWFVKEAHSDGDNGSLFEIESHAQSLFLHRNSEKGEETVRILFPYLKKDREIRLSNQEFGKWLRAREKSGGTQFVFLNASCWSVDKAQNDIPEAATPLLVEIITDSLTDFFRNSGRNGMRTVIQGLRRGRSYPEIRSDLQKSEDYLAGSADVFLFPDESRYTQKIFLNESALRIRTKLWNEDGKRYYGENFNPQGED